jgi:hypothetical protein
MHHLKPNILGKMWGGWHMEHMYYILCTFLLFVVPHPVLLQQRATVKASITKVIIEKSRGEVSLMGQDTIENVS